MNERALGIDVSRIPTMLALPLAELAAETNPRLALWHICDATEMALRFSVIVGIAEHLRARRGDLPAELRRELRGRISAPTLGMWLGMANAVVAGLPEKAIVPELKSFVARLAASLGSGSSDPDTHLMPVRNRLAHGGAVSFTLMQRLLERHRPRLAETLRSAGWLEDIRLVAPWSSAGIVELRGTSWQTLSTDAEALDVHPREAVVLERAGSQLVLWPLTTFARPREESDAHTLNVYMRRDEEHLLFTPLGAEDAFESWSGDDGLTAFRRLFESEPQEQAFSVPGFEQELLREAAELIGREYEKRVLLDAIARPSSKIVWLSGRPGSGKSTLLARVAADLLASPGDRFILAYRFKIGDVRSTRERFLAYAIERLTASPSLGTPPKDVNPPSSLEEQLSQLLARMHCPVNIILDGLDEIVERDRHFVEDIVLRAPTAHVTWVCSARPVDHVTRPLRAAGHAPLFPDGLPPMTASDIRALLVERTGRARRRLLALDRSLADDRTMNPFIERVTRHADGLPLYVRYLVGDVLAGRIKIAETETTLPPSLDAYHERLLERTAIGDLQQVLTPMIAMMAIVQEPLSIAALQDLLVQRSLLLEGDEGARVLERGLRNIETMVRTIGNRETGKQYQLFHASLVRHVVSSPTMALAVRTSARALADMATRWRTLGASRSTLLRRGARILLEEGRDADAAALLVDVDYLVARADEGARETILDISSDLDECARRLTTNANVQAVARFVASHRHQLAERAGQMLLQLAYAEADDFVLTSAAEARTAARFLRRIGRPARRDDPTLAVFDTWDGKVTAIAADTRSIIVGTSAGRVLVLDRASGRRDVTLQAALGHIIDAVAIHPTLPIVACVANDVLRVWHRAEQRWLVGLDTIEAPGSSDFSDAMRAIRRQLQFGLGDHRAPSLAFAPTAIVLGTHHRVRLISMDSVLASAPAFIDVTLSDGELDGAVEVTEDGRVFVLTMHPEVHEVDLATATTRRILLDHAYEPLDELLPGSRILAIRRGRVIIGRWPLELRVYSLATGALEGTARQTPVGALRSGEIIVLDDLHVGLLSGENVNHWLGRARLAAKPEAVTMVERDRVIAGMPDGSIRIVEMTSDMTDDATALGMVEHVMALDDGYCVVHANCLSLWRAGRRTDVIDLEQDSARQIEMTHVVGQCLVQYLVARSTDQPNVVRVTNLTTHAMSLVEGALFAVDGNGFVVQRSHEATWFDAMGAMQATLPGRLLAHRDTRALMFVNDELATVARHQGITRQFNANRWTSRALWMRDAITSCVADASLARVVLGTSSLSYLAATSRLHERALSLGYVEWAAFAPDGALWFRSEDDVFRVPPNDSHIERLGSIETTYGYSAPEFWLQDGRALFTGLHHARLVSPTPDGFTTELYLGDLRSTTFVERGERLQVLAEHRCLRSYHSSTGELLQSVDVGPDMKHAVVRDDLGVVAATGCDGDRKHPPRGRYFHMWSLDTLQPVAAWCADAEIVAFVLGTDDLALSTAAGPPLILRWR